MTEYAELHCFSNFTFLEGASHAEELVQQAASLGLKAIAITDRNTLAGVVRAHTAAKDADIQLIIGAQLDFADAPSVLCLPTDLAAYSRLSQLISLGRRRVPKGECLLYWADFLGRIEGQQVVLLAPERPDPDFIARLQGLHVRIGDDLSLGISNLLRGGDRQRIEIWARIAEQQGVALLAMNDVLYHHPDRARLQDVLAATRHKCTVQQLGLRAESNAECHLKPAGQMAELFRGHPQALARTLDVASRCRFSLSELKYVYPEESKGESATPQAELERLTWLGAQNRFPNGIPPKVRGQIEHELRLVEQLNYAAYFLTVNDIVRFARSEGILCQGRGSAANSVICYCLGVTSVNPESQDLLVERFISAERAEPPDIDIDFEHERREEVIQYIYRKYGRDRAGIAATVISFRTKLALRTVGRALGLSMDAITHIAKTLHWWSKERYSAEALRDAGIDPDSKLIRLTVQLANELVGFPRHISQHVGGFVITNGPLADLVPVENARMADRTVVQWDKDDLEALGLLKVDVLALGMLTCIQKCFGLIERHYGKKYELHTVPQDDEATYDMICEADTIGVFQIESRAQMSMLPRLRPRDLYDLVVEVAIVRPGPIQGNMVHPYLQRRKNPALITYEKEDLRPVLEKTHGVPLFQEQAMRISMVCAGFTAGEADGLRRAMATFKRNGTIGKYRDKLIDGMLANGYSREFAENIFSQLKGFADYGFPESHAASFAILAYVSSWLKCHYPAAFAAAILNAQPMGFYSASRLVIDARDHGVEVRPIDVNYSHWDHRLEPHHGRHGQALRLGFRQIKGFRQDDADRIAAQRGEHYDNLRDLWRRTQLPVAVLEQLARADAFGSFGLDRRSALWTIKGLNDGALPLFDYTAAQPRGSNAPPAALDDREEDASLPRLTTGENVIQDFRANSLSLRPHALALLRPQLRDLGLVTAKDLQTLDVNKRIRIAGLVQVRQRPGTASGVIFATLQDETGDSNIIIWPRVFDAFRREVLGGRMMIVEGRLQRESTVVHVVAERIADGTPYLTGLGEIDWENDFGEMLSPADEVKKPLRDPLAARPREIREVMETFPDGRNFR
ncbi:error-prone DNA polymerase [Ferrovibrio sp.]|uniref:error-prone DNA polymerase n=1 Tax=Ferrovibrio sp. TaxID=1917215 RepID=UPI000CAC3C13|nr:error-prone DNA polymerase [Ferrovibrio sp.]PJI37371.1 MAG: error-prone DNA polymerase [Ferrovibrio sp.]